MLEATEMFIYSNKSVKYSWGGFIRVMVLRLTCASLLEDENTYQYGNSGYNQ